MQFFLIFGEIIEPGFDTATSSGKEPREPVKTREHNDDFE
jgi:hypothetical protein